jgi:hypothetical protein
MSKLSNTFVGLMVVLGTAMITWASYQLGAHLPSGCQDSVTLVTTAYQSRQSVSCRDDQLLLIPRAEVSPENIGWLVGCMCLKGDKPNPFPMKTPKVPANPATLAEESNQ